MTESVEAVEELDDEGDEDAAAVEDCSAEQPKVKSKGRDMLGERRERRLSEERRL